MKHTFFPKLAWSGIQKNRKLYIPYILTCVGMVMMFYILQSLSYSPLLHEMRGGSNMEVILSLGKFVIAVFALIFLLYTNSFLIRRRNKEFGLYNILGMDKSGICHVVAWESLMVSAMGMVGGLFLGILFSKLAELGLLNELGLDTDFRLHLSLEAIFMTAGIFLFIYLLLFVKSVLQVRLSKPMELLRNEAMGEKPPKANWILALLGVGLLGTAYYLAVTIKDPLLALTLFFVAVIMVIVGTYFLFIAGSVTLCRILQKRKRYYYKKQHFVSVSSMAFRMKRNGAGLASICILLTMVLVILSSTSSLYLGSQNVIDTMYPRENQMTFYPNSLSALEDGSLIPYREAMEQILSDHGETPTDILDFHYTSISGRLTGNTLEPDVSDADYSLSQIRSLFFISQADYNLLTGANVHLEPGHALLHTDRCTYEEQTLNIKDVSLIIDGTIPSFRGMNATFLSSVASLTMVIPDYITLEPLSGLQTDFGQPMLNTIWYYGYDLGVDSDTAMKILGEQGDMIHQLATASALPKGYAYSYTNADAERYDYLSTFGGLFFIGIMLSLVFLAAAVLIIYYKQLSEGYEDQSRFAIMKKVGMTSRDIRGSINSQILTVFFAPLIFAGLHLGFAFPMVWQLLQLFSLHNLGLVIGTTCGAFLLCGVFYAIVYKITAGAYFSIVNEKETA